MTEHFRLHKSSNESMSTYACAAVLLHVFMKK